MQTAAVTMSACLSGSDDTAEYISFATPLGRVTAAACDDALVFLAVHDEDSICTDRRFQVLQARRTDRGFLRGARQCVIDYLDGRTGLEPVSLNPQGTPFQRAVWQQLSAIPFGRTVSYGQVAASMGCPQAIRAVASACAANPLALFIPCHRVLGRNGRLAGYRWGVARKERLLGLEQSIS